MPLLGIDIGTSGTKTLLIDDPCFRGRQLMRTDNNQNMERC